MKGNARLVFDSFSRCSVVYCRSFLRPVSNESDGLRSVDPNTITASSSPRPAQEAGAAAAAEGNEVTYSGPSTSSLGFYTYTHHPPAIYIV